MQKILVVNSDEDLLSLLKSWLKKRSYQVKYTTSKKDVVPTLESFGADLAIVDVAEKEVVADIRANLSTNSLPVLLMTGHTSRGVAVDVDVDDTIEKPFDLVLLKHKVEKLLGNGFPKS